MVEGVREESIRAGTHCGGVWPQLHTGGGLDLVTAMGEKGERCDLSGVFNSPSNGPRIGLEVEPLPDAARRRDEELGAGEGRQVAMTVVAKTKNGGKVTFAFHVTTGVCGFGRTKQIRMSGRPARCGVNDRLACWNTLSPKSADSSGL